MPLEHRISGLNHLGFRHVLEDGLASVRGESTIEQKRRQVVLADLENLFDKASRGSEVEAHEFLLLDPAQSEAVRSFNFLERYLIGPDQEGVSAKLEQIAKVFHNLISGTQISGRMKAEAEALLEAMLRSVEYLDSPTIPETPEDIDLNE